MGRGALIAMLALIAMAEPAAADAPAALYRLDVPAGWRDAPELVAGPEAEKEDPRPQRQAWADPAAGLFLLVQSLEIGAAVDPVELHHSVRDGLAPALSVKTYEESQRGLELESRFAFERGALRGVVRTLSAPTAAGALRIASVSCFYNQRQASASELRCREIAASLGVKP